MESWKVDGIVGLGVSSMLCQWPADSATKHQIYLSMGFITSSFRRYGRLVREHHLAYWGDVNHTVLELELELELRSNQLHVKITEWRILIRCTEVGLDCLLAAAMPSFPLLELPHRLPTLLIWQIYFTSMFSLPFRLLWRGVYS